MRVLISSKAIVSRLMMGVGFLLVMHTAVQIAKFVFAHDHLWGMAYLFDLEQEFNFPTLYSHFLFSVAAVLLWIIAYEGGRQRGKYVWHWAGMSLLFFWLSFDEILSLHERWEIPLREVLHTSGLLYYVWQLPYVIIGLGALVFYFPFFKDLNKQVRHQMIWAAALYISAVVVLECLGGWYFSSYGQIKDLGYVSISTAEEVLEMTGVIVFIHALLIYLRLESPILQFELASESTGSAQTR